MPIISAVIPDMHNICALSNTVTDCCAPGTKVWGPSRKQRRSCPGFELGNSLTDDKCGLALAIVSWGGGDRIREMLGLLTKYLRMQRT